MTQAHGVMVKRILKCELAIVVCVPAAVLNNSLSIGIELYTTKMNIIITDLKILTTT